jgi:teichuronic acid biosynthesis glycosyltransferase TuaH
MPARTAPRARRGRDGLIVVCAVASYDGIRMSDWHLAQHLSKLAPVLYVDPPSFRHPAARGPRRTDRLRQEGPGLARLVPMVPPFPARPAVAGTTAALIRRDLRWATARLGGQVSAVLSGWPQFPVFGACGERVRAYWAKDDFVAGAALFGLNAAMLQRRERQVAAAADLLIAANPAVAAMWRSSGRDPLLIPFGTDAAAYLGTDRAPLPPGVSLPPPVAGFIGRLNARTDLALLEAIAARGRSLLLVGPKDPGCDQRRFAALQDRPNVHWAGQQPAAALPGYLRLMDVGLVPYTPSRFNLGSFPLKVLEYLAAGRPVAATDLPALRALDTDLIHLTGPASFADQVDHLLTQPRTPQLAARCQAFAAQHTWAQRATDIHHALTSYPPPPAHLPSGPKSSVRAVAATRSGPVDQ